MKKFRLWKLPFLKWATSGAAFAFSVLLFSPISHVTNIQQELKDSLSIVAVGDVMLDGNALPFIRKKGADYPFDSTKTIIQSADIAFANLEAPFTSSGNIFKKKFIFKVPPEYAVGLVYAGFDILSLANNHILDYGKRGLLSTLHTLDSLGIAHCGAGRDLKEAEQESILKKNGWRVGFLAYSLTYPEGFWATSERCGTAYPDLKGLKKNISSLKRKVDIVVVSFHWGSELMIHPKSYQRFYAHRAIDWGADLVLGHHPHVLQGLEIYNSKLIAYSLGNFVFGSYSSKVQESIILKVRFDRNGSLTAQVIPIFVFNFKVRFQPRLLKRDARGKVLQKLNIISKDLNQGEKIIAESGYIIKN